MATRNVISIVAPTNLLLVVAVVALQLSMMQWCHAFTIPSLSSKVTTTTPKTTTGATTFNNGIIALFASSSSSDDNDDSGGTLFFADVAKEANTKTTTNNNNNDDKPSPPPSPPSSPQLFDSSTLAEANDALNSVGWGSMAPPMEDGEMTSDDPFVKQIDESIQKEMGVGLDELLNPAKVVNLERDLYNLRNELATLTGATLPKDDDAPLLTTQLCDAGGGGEEATTIRSKITKKEKDLANERRAVFRGWLKNIFLGQALLSMALSYVMSTNPDALFGNFPWYNTISNMDTSISVLGFWWWWLFIVPSLRSRRPSGWEKEALDIAFLGTPLISILSPVVTKDTGIIWMANFAVVVGAYGFAYLGDGGEDGGGGSGEDGGNNQPGWLKFIYKSLDFGSGRERGARR
ncbi:hypothetical protein ACHAXR_008702 [Thalassiosira sp. AJA248-18]